MRQSTLALICGLILFVVLAYSWCGRNPPPQGNALLTTPTPTPAPSVITATPQATPSPSVSVAPATATPPMQTPPPEFRTVARTAAPAIIEITVFDAKGQLLRTGNAFFVSRDGLLVTSWTMVANAGYGVAKSPDGKIRNVTGVLASDQQSDLAILRAETKVGVPTLSLAKNSESIAVNAWAVLTGSFANAHAEVGAQSASSLQSGAAISLPAATASFRSDHRLGKVSGYIRREWTSKECAGDRIHRTGTSRLGCR